MTKRTNDLLAEAAEHERAIHDHRRKRDRAIVRARKAGATFKECAEATGLTIRSIQMAIERDALQ